MSTNNNSIPFPTLFNSSANFSRASSGSHHSFSGENRYFLSPHIQAATDSSDSSDSENAHSHPHSTSAHQSHSYSHSHSHHVRTPAESLRRQPHTSLSPVAEEASTHRWSGLTGSPSAWSPVGPANGAFEKDLTIAMMAITPAGAHLKKERHTSKRWRGKRVFRKIRRGIGWCGRALMEIGEAVALVVCCKPKVKY